MKKLIILLNLIIYSVFTYGQSMTWDINGNTINSGEYIGTMNPEPFSIWTNGMEHLSLTINGILEFKNTKDNIFIGENAGRNNDFTVFPNGSSYGSKNIAIGANAFKDSKTGQNNIAIGYQTMENSDESVNNIAVGYRALKTAVLGGENVAIGSNSLEIAKLVGGNVSIGLGSMRNTIKGNRNTALGNYALINNDSGDFNVGVGVSASGINSNYGIYIGGHASSLNKNTIHEVVIGATASGLGSNTIIFGNDQNKITALTGNVGIGTKSPQNKLEVTTKVNGQSGIRITDIKSNGTAPQPNPGPGVLSVNQDGDVIYVQTQASPPPSNPTTASNGLTIDGTDVQLGNICGKNGSEFKEDREIIQNNQNLYFTSTNGEEKDNANGKIYMGYDRCKELETRLEISSLGINHPSKPENIFKRGIPSTSGLRFSDLTSNDKPINNEAEGVLSLDEDGDVIWVEKNSASSGNMNCTSNNFVPKYNASSNTYDCSQIFDDGTSIGIGTPSPVAKLDVRRGNNSAATYGTALFHGTNYASHFSYGPDEHTFIRGGKLDGNVILNDANIGNVGAGVNDPNNMLEILGKERNTIVKNTYANTGVSGLRLRNLQAGPNPVQNPGKGVLSVDGNGDVIYVASGSSPISNCNTANFLTRSLGNNTYTCSQVFDNGTNVGIGTTTPIDRFTVYNNANGFRGITLDGDVNAQSRLVFSQLGTARSVIYRPANSSNLSIWGYGGNFDILYMNTVNGNIGIGNITNPNNFLEVNGKNPNLLSTNTSQNTGFSGLRLRNLRANAPYTTNPGKGVLSVNDNGDVIYVENASSPISNCNNANFLTRSLGNNTYTCSQVFDNGTRVGIGTSAPNDLVTIFNNNGSNGLTLDAAQTLSSRISFKRAGIEKSVLFRPVNSDDLAIWGNNFGATLFYLNTTGGRLGLLTSSPRTTLDINSNILNTSGLSFTNLNINSPTQIPVRNRYLSLNTVGEVILVDAVGSGTGNTTNTCTTPNFLPRLSNTPNTYTCSQVFDNGTNVGIGTTTPIDRFTVYNNANGFRGITLDGDVNAQSRLVFSQLGTARSVIYRPANSSNLSVWGYGCNFDILYMNTVNGNVGIGNNAPTHRFHVTGNARITDLPTKQPTDAIVFASTDASNNGLLRRLPASGVSTQYLGGDGAWHNLTSGPSTSTANNGLLVNNGNIQLGRACGDNTTDADLLESRELPLNNNNFIFRDGNNTTADIHSNKVGIGNLNACDLNAKLHVRRDDNSTTEFENIGVISEINTTTNGNGDGPGNGHPITIAYDAINHSGDFSTNIGNRINVANGDDNIGADIIVDGGRLRRGIGVHLFTNGVESRGLDITTSGDQTLGLDVRSGGAGIVRGIRTQVNSDHLAIGGEFLAQTNAQNITNTNFGCIGVIGTALNDGNNILNDFGVYGDYINTNGTINSNDFAVFANGPIGGSSGWTSSDKKLKSDVKNIDNALSIISKINPRTYNYKNEEFPDLNLPQSDINYGVIAQELEEVLPNLVREAKVPTRDKKSTVDFKMVNYTELIPITIQAVKELNSKVEKQNNAVVENEALKSEIELLKSENELMKQKFEMLEKSIAQICESGCGGLKNPTETSKDANTLFQSIPNPTDREALINYYLVDGVKQAEISIFAQEGKIINTQKLETVKGNGSIKVDLSQFSNGTYIYSLIVDGKVIDTKRIQVLK